MDANEVPFEPPKVTDGLRNAMLTSDRVSDRSISKDFRRNFRVKYPNLDVKCICLPMRFHAGDQSNCMSHPLKTPATAKKVQSKYNLMKDYRTHHNRDYQSIKEFCPEISYDYE